MSKTFRVLKFINNDVEQEFMVASSWSTDVDIFLLNTSDNENQWKTAIKSNDFQEVSVNNQPAFRSLMDFASFQMNWAWKKAILDQKYLTLSQNHKVTPTLSKL